MILKNILKLIMKKENYNKEKNKNEIKGIFNKKDLISPSYINLNNP